MISPSGEVFRQTLSVTLLAFVRKLPSGLPQRYINNENDDVEYGDAENGC